MVESVVMEYVVKMEAELMESVVAEHKFVT